ncbi:MAG: ISAzo13-like element transposase-related protein [Candidatus Dormibacteria bacterium]
MVQPTPAPRGVGYGSTRRVRSCPLPRGGSSSAGCFTLTRVSTKPGAVHYPTSASKWNPIEHRLFSAVSKNWAGRPLDSYETILNYASTTTGLKVSAYLVNTDYPTGIKVATTTCSSCSYNLTTPSPPATTP